MKLPILVTVLISVLLLTLSGAALAQDGSSKNPAAAGGDGETFLDSGGTPSRTLREAEAPGPVAIVEGLLCCPPDDRIQFTNTEIPILRSIAFLELYDSGGISGSCSGTLVGPNAVLTAAHCLYHPTFGWVTDIAVVPGKSGLNEPYGFQWAANWWVPDAWITSGGASIYDWGIISLPDSTLGNSLGWLPLVSMTTNTLSRNDFLPTIIGYPGDKPTGTMWGNIQNSFLSVNQFTLDYLIDTASGQSGSAVFSLNDQEWFGGAIVGIHTQGSIFYNTGTRIDEELLNDLLIGCAVMACQISGFVEGGPTITPPPPPSATPTPSPTSTQSPTASPTKSATPTHTPAASTPVGSATPTPTPAGVIRIWGDINCSGSSNPVDSLGLLRYDAGLTVNSPASCPDVGDAVFALGGPKTWGNVDCTGNPDPIDALKLLRHDASLPVNQPVGCPAIGQQVLVS